MNLPEFITKVEELEREAREFSDFCCVEGDESGDMYYKGKARAYDRIVIMLRADLDEQLEGLYNQTRKEYAKSRKVDQSL